MRLGRHMPTGSRMVKAAEIAHELGCETIQIFASNPTGWKPPEHSVEECSAFAQATHQRGITPIVLHAPYLINLASPDAQIWQKSSVLLTRTLQQAALLDARYVVFHTGSHRGAGLEVGIARIVQALEQILAETPETVMPLLENGVGAGHALGDQFEHLAAIIEQLPIAYQQRVGVCLDTAHLWGAGHDLTSAESTRHVIDCFDSIVGAARLGVLHVNDTAVALGSHRDVHARLGEGIISEEGLHTLLTDPRLTHVAALLETPIQTDEQGKEDWEHDKRHFARFQALASH